MRIDWDHKFLRWASAGMLLTGGLVFGALLSFIIVNILIVRPTIAGPDGTAVSEGIKWTIRLTDLSLTMLMTAITILLTYSAYTVFRRKKSNVLFMAVGLTVGLPVAMLISHIILTWNSILWELAPDFMKDAMLSAFLNAGVVLLVMAAWFAVPIARAARLSTSSPTNAYQIL